MGGIIKTSNFLSSANSSKKYMSLWSLGAFWSTLDLKVCLMNIISISLCKRKTRKIKENLA